MNKIEGKYKNEGSKFQITERGGELLILLKNPTKEEVESIEKGLEDFAWVPSQGVLTILWRFVDQPLYETVFFRGEISEEELEPWKEGDFPIEIILADIEDNTIHGTHKTILPKEEGEEFIGNISQMKDWSGRKALQYISTLQQKYTSEELFLFAKKRRER